MLLAAQPIVPFGSAFQGGYELLARCRDERGGFSAAFLLELSEVAQKQFDLCIAKALPRAVNALALSIGELPAFVSFNLFPISIQDNKQQRMLLDALVQAQQTVAPVQLVAEFSENLTMPYQDELAAIEAFRNAGLFVARDDHHNSSSCLPRLPLPWHWVKLDMSLMPVFGGVSLIRRLKATRPDITIIVERCACWENTLALLNAGADGFQAFHHGRPFLLPSVDGKRTPFLDFCRHGSCLHCACNVQPKPLST